MSEIEKLEAAVVDAERERDEANAEVERLLDEAYALDLSTEGRDGLKLEFNWPTKQRVNLR